MKKVLMVFIVCIFLPSVTKGQNDSFIDLTVERKKIFTLGQTLTDNEVHSMSGTGGRGISVGCGAAPGVGEVKISPIKVTLEAIDKFECIADQNITYEIKVENTSTKAITIPWSVETDKVISESNKNNQLSIESIFGLGIKDSNYGFRSFLVNVLDGSESLPDSLKTLQPGETARIRAMSNFAISEDDFAQGEMVKSFDLQGIFSLSAHPYNSFFVIKPVISENSIRIQVRKPEPQPESK